MKHISLLAIALVLTAPVASIEIDIQDSCRPTEEVNLFSLADREGGNIGMPGFFSNQVCAEGISETQVSWNCSRASKPVISMFKKNDTHGSMFDSLRWDVCATGIETELNKTCSNGDPIVSMYQKDDSHVAEPGHFTKQLCYSRNKPDNITLTMEIDNSKEVYVESGKADERNYSAPELNYPYIVTSQPSGIVSGGDYISLSYSDGAQIDKLRMVQTEGSFLLPHTTGGVKEVEDEEEAVLAGRFLDRVSPSFAFQRYGKPLVRVALDPDRDLKGFEGEERNAVKLYTQNQGSDVIAVKPVQ